MKASDVIREGRNQLFEKGWNQGSAESSDGRICSVHAVNLARTALHATDLRLEEYVDALNLGVPGGEAVSIWQDRPGRKFDEVIDAFDRAEKIAEQREANDA